MRLADVAGNTMAMDAFLHAEQISSKIALLSIYCAYWTKNLTSFYPCTSETVLIIWTVRNYSAKRFYSRIVSLF
jgi:hypothetical protein